MDDRLARLPSASERVPRAGRRMARVSDAGLLFLGVLFTLPMVWLFVASFDSQASFGIAWPHFTLQNFQTALRGAQLRSLWDSLILAGVATVIATVSSSLAAYALSRRRIPFKGPALLVVLFLSGVPMSIVIVPIYQMYASQGLLSIIPAAVFLGVSAIPFDVWIIKNYMDTIPIELEEAAWIERASNWQVFTRVVGPLALPGIAVGAIYAFVSAWGSFVVPLVLISNPSQEPGQIAIFNFIGSAVVRYGDIAAFSLIYAVPVFILYGLTSRVFAGGFALGGAIKG